MLIHQKARKLVQQGHEISVTWVPGHSGVEGNERADKVAKETAIGDRVRTAMDQFDSCQAKNQGTRG